MNPENLNDLINLIITFIALLIGWRIIPLNVPEEKREKWEKVQPYFKWCATIAFVGFVLVAILKRI